MVYLNQAQKTLDLVIGLQNKSEEAFSELYDHYSTALWCVAVKLVKDETVAEEILQDVFVKIWRFIDKYDTTKGSFFNWMLNITRNTCKDYFRSKRYQNSLLQEELGEPDRQKLRHFEKQEESAELLILTQKLEPKYKEVIELVYIYGYSQVEVSEQLQVPLGTIKTRSREALRQLRLIYFS